MKHLGFVAIIFLLFVSGCFDSSSDSKREDVERFIAITGKPILKSFNVDTGLPFTYAVIKFASLNDSKFYPSNEVYEITLTKKDGSYDENALFFLYDEYACSDSTLVNSGLINTMSINDDRVDTTKYISITDWWPTYSNTLPEGFVE